jgi:hypothetical protein
MTCDLVIQAEQYGFREAAHVLDGARQMAAKELANDPNLRRYVRYDFEKYSVATARLTPAGENSSEEYHREFVSVDKYYGTPLREIGSESFLWMMKANKEGLLDVDIKLPADRQEKLTEELMRYYKSDNSNPSAVHTHARTHTHTHTHIHTYTHYTHTHTHTQDAWNAERRKIMVEALEKNLGTVLALSVAEAKITKAKRAVGNEVRSKLEELLRVPPYLLKGAAGKDSKRTKPPDRIMACCFAEPAEFVVIDKRGEVLAFKSMYLRVGRNHRCLNLCRYYCFFLLLS